MSGRSAAATIALLEDEAEDESTLLANEVDVHAYDSETSDDEDNGPEYIEIPDEDEEPPTPPGPDSDFHDEPPTEFEIPSLSLDCGLVKPGSVVELHDRSERTTDALISGDFLFVRQIIENVETEEVVLRGYRLRRCSYLRPLFDGKMNDLFMLLHTRRDDDRPTFVQGIEDVGVEEVINLRKCVFTNLAYDVLGLQQVNGLVPARYAHDRDSLKSWIFKKGTLICRWVHIVEVYDFTKGTSYAGEVRRMYKREAVDFMGSESPVHFPTAKANPPTPSHYPTPTHGASPNSHKRTRSLEIVETPRSKRRQQLPIKITTYTMGDGFCGFGGTSDGAQQAGFKIVWGLEKDPVAMAAYKRNFPSAMHLEMDAWDFKDFATRRRHGVDCLHFSCPCQYWAECKTVHGVNDQANMETIYIPHGWLLKLRPRLFTMEQSPGLIKKEKHRLHFRRVLNDFLSAGYNVRYRVQNLAWFGISQQRRRLIFLGAKIGQPLPAFPKPVYGPSGSGLKRFITIEDALRPLMRVENRLTNDKYHQKYREKKMNVAPVDPHVSMANCVTTNGGDNAHYTGKRAMTPRELSQLQGFRVNYHFAGCVSDAKRQSGNAFPPPPVKQHYLLCGATLEAYDNGLINAEDDIQDLYDFLEQKGVTIERPVIGLDGLSGCSDEPTNCPQYRYLSRLEKTVKPRIPLVLWGRKSEVQRRPPRTRRAATSSVTGLDGAADIRRSRTLSVRPRGREVQQQEQKDGTDDEIVFLGSRRKSS